MFCCLPFLLPQQTQKHFEYRLVEWQTSASAWAATLNKEGQLQHFNKHLEFWTEPCVPNTTRRSNFTWSGPTTNRVKLWRFVVFEKQDYGQNSRFWLRNVENSENRVSKCLELRGLEASDGKTELRNVFFGELPVYLDINKFYKPIISIRWTALLLHVLLANRYSRYLTA